MAGLAGIMKKNMKQESKPKQSKGGQKKNNKMIGGKPGSPKKNKKLKDPHHEQGRTSRSPRSSESSEAQTQNERGRNRSPKKNERTERNEESEERTSGNSLVQNYLMKLKEQQEFETKSFSEAKDDPKFSKQENEEEFDETEGSSVSLDI